MKSSEGIDRVPYLRRKLNITFRDGKMYAYSFILNAVTKLRAGILHSFRIGSGAHPASYPMDTELFFSQE
jgi:hypothetical protein